MIFPSCLDMRRPFTQEVGSPCGNAVGEKMYRERCIVSLQSYNDKNIPKAMPWGYLACYSETLVKLRPVLTGGGLGVVVVVGGFHDVIINPTPSPREPSATLHNGRKMPMEGFGVFQVRDKEECKRSVLEAIIAGYPVFEHRNLATICETTVLCLLHTRVSRQAEKPCLHIQ